MKKVPKEKKHSCAFDLEMQEITDACEHFREYLLNIEFKIFTDHMLLMYHQLNFKNPNARLARLVSKLDEYTFKIQHIKGSPNRLADYLSRKDEEIDEEYFKFKEGEFKLHRKNINVRTTGQEVRTRGQETGENSDQPENENTFENELQEKWDIGKLQREDKYWAKMN